MSFYTEPAQIEPLFIDSSRPVYPELLGAASELVEASARLDAAIHPATAKALSELVAGMNCYYSNLIEGHHTLPIDIAKALEEQVKEEGKRDVRSLAEAHIASEKWAREQSVSGIAAVTPFLLEIHRRFCEQLPQEQLVLEDGSLMVPGKLRDRDVKVGRHIAPTHAALESFLDRYASAYGRRMEWASKGGQSKLDGLLAAFAAHHRLTWIHPFPDGNGRVARIALDAMIRQCGVNTGCIWSMSRGLAKNSDEYKAHLAGADQPRMGDLDGRGNLSEKRLVEFIMFGLKTAKDQARFMSSLFGLDNLKARVHGYFSRVRFDLAPESEYLYLQVLQAGEFDRGEAARLTGKADRTARNILQALAEEGFLLSDTPKGKVRAGFPVRALGSLFPNLYPAGDVDFPDQMPTTTTGRAKKRR